MRLCNQLSLVRYGTVTYSCNIIISEKKKEKRKEKEKKDEMQEK